MPFIVKPIEEIKTEIINPTVDKINQGDKMDVVLVILIVLLMFVFRGITAFLFKAIGVVIIGLGIYTLIS